MLPGFQTLHVRCAALLALATALPATAQDEGEPERPPIRPELVDLARGEPSPQEEMARLFQAIERRLRDMGTLLLDASAGDTSRLSEVGESGILELLREASPSGQAGGGGGVGELLGATQVGGQKVLEDIDRILDIAAQNGGT